ncbi:NADP-dependent oxidoreductase domain-containing protein 1 [Aulostomus maculatus]
MEDFVGSLSSFSFEGSLTEDERKFLYLRARSARLTFCGCAHAAFLCKLVNALRGAIKSNGEDLSLGILGMGHMGKQLLLVLLEQTGVKPSQIQISTRRPESAVAFLPAGVECFSDNGRLAARSDVLFLCCLPSHLLKVCADLRAHLPKHCLVYSFTSAVPVTRLARLLGHDFILKPQCDLTADDWPSCTRVTTALKDSELIEASCPLRTKGDISLGVKWGCAVLYSLLNICTSAGLGSSDALSMIASIFKEKWPQEPELNTQSFITSSQASSLPPNEPFPWISLTDAQTKETPLLHFLSGSESLQRCISAAYKSQLETTVKRD